MGGMQQCWRWVGTRQGRAGEERRLTKRENKVKEERHKRDPPADSDDSAGHSRRLNLLRPTPCHMRLDSAGQYRRWRPTCGRGEIKLR